jgi:large subunit ribosomal protein L29
MKAAKWRDLSDDEIQQKARELNEEIFNLRFQLSMGVAKNPARIGQARKDLARAKTILHERRVPDAAASAPAATVVATPVLEERATAPAARKAAAAPKKKASAARAKTKTTKAPARAGAKKKGK